MSVARAGYLMALMICFPLFIHTWGQIYNAISPIDAALVIEESIKLLCALTGIAMFFSAPFFFRAFPIKQSLLGHFLLISAPLPFIALASLADAVSIFMPVKFLGVQLLVSFLTVTLVLPFNRFRIFNYLPIKLDMPVCLIAATYFWKTSDLWLRWIM